MDWTSLADVLNKELGNEDKPFSEAAYRKPYQQAKRFYEAGVFKQYTDEDSYFKELQIQKRDLEKETVKVRDERNELRRLIREEARKESYKDQVIRSIEAYCGKPLDYDSDKQFTGILNG